MFTEVNRELRGHPFMPPKSSDLPELYQSEHTQAADKPIWARFYLGSMNWWLAEWDLIQGLAFGLVTLGDGRERDAEWGYFLLPELEAIRVDRLMLLDGAQIAMPAVVERDLTFVAPLVARDAIPSQFHRDWWFG